MILLEGEEKGAHANIVTCRVWRILLEGEEKSAYANIVIVGCG